MEPNTVIKNATPIQFVEWLLEKNFTPIYKYGEKEIFLQGWFLQGNKRNSAEHTLTEIYNDFCAEMLKQLPVNCPNKPIDRAGGIWVCTKANGCQKCFTLP